jgi:spore coat polysaccharide biosynthesis protein SpsF
MKTVGIIQARMGSTRLPGKVMLDLAGEPMLVRIVRRVQGAEALASTIVATTTLPQDDSIAKLCAEHGWICFRGSENDLLDRYYCAALAHHADVIVRITADCPLIDPAIVDQVVQTFTEHQPEVDYVSNIFPTRTFPRGLDTEVISFDALERAWRDDHNPAWREHVTPYIRENPKNFYTLGVSNHADYSHLRWTVDTPEDLELISRIYGHFGNKSFSWQDALDLLKRHQNWSEINRHVEQKAVV